METREQGELSQEALLARLDALGEWFAAGFLSLPGASPARRMAAGIRRYLEHAPLPEYTGRRLYPHGPTIWQTGNAVYHHYVQMEYARAIYERKRAAAATDEDRAALDAMDAFFSSYPYAAGYTHSIPNYRRILNEGLDAYRERVEKHRALSEKRGEAARAEWYEAFGEVLDAVAGLRRRCIEKIQAAALESPGAEQNREALLAALARVPFAPARSFTEAMVAENFLFYLDGCDDLGRFDQDLLPYYERSRPSDEEALALIGELWENVDDACAWNVALGGTTRDGDPAYNPLTLLALRAGKGRRRPNLALRLRRDTPEAVWDTALETLSGGTGIPALYAEENYLAALEEAHLNVSRADLHDFAFGGCTETMIAGCSNVGSLDDKINLPEILVNALHAELPACASFDAFLERIRPYYIRQIREITDRVSRYQERRARHHPQLIRSLLIDDCIDNGRDYAAGGARYNWSVINVEGLGNVIDSLAAIREVVYERREVTPERLLSALRDNWEGDEALRRRVQRCPRYGNGDPAVDALAREFSEFIFREFLRYAPYRGGKFLPSCLMFVTYADEGQRVAATPDGRRAGEPIADSAGAVQGRDRSGPTAALQSAASLDTRHAPGTLVVNIRLSKQLFADREKVKALVRGYFALGGLQVQINVVDQAVLRDALEHPEQHGDLIIRVGGYSEYWTRLSRPLQESVLQRVEHV
ncbi:MAG TPA: pyruvate formate lyase family protein [Armatimonadota bacterium]|nr:hypothetical protein [Armatimonadota bacterium]HOJ20898.1 pyruvate formate lyase family protein [Armatimonadota bacterium]HOM82648.1 pyruvate formate lyase family protein [Armatimonadota bacterium]HOQ27365.1 pyruvate formate lyase family protein [Armatimonadota bacterium]HPO74225.1 pyruvate formate lyase family protein [Armatimonadota bacterium]